MSDLPNGWVETKLGECCEVVGGSTPKTTVAEFWNGDTPWITPDDLSRHASKLISCGARSITDAGYASCSTSLVPAGTVLFTSRAPIGYAAIAAGSVCTNQGFKSFVPLGGILSDYLYWYLRHATPAIQAMGSGTTFKEISKKTAQSIPIPLPPLPEQHRIVAAIEEQFSRLDAAEESLRRARRNLERFRGAALASAFDNGSPTTKIGEFARVGSGATPQRDRADYWGGSIPWVTSGQLSSDFVDEPAEFITERALAETSVKPWPAGTLLVAMYGEGQTRGRCSELRFESTSNQACAAIVVDEERVDRTYLKRFFAASYESNRRLASGGVQPNLSLGIIRDLEVPLPPLDEQRRIVAEVERQLSLIEAQADAIDMALKRSATLRRAILERAFTGTLVSQDPEDEPASALLERIRADRKPAEKRTRAGARS